MTQRPIIDLHADMPGKAGELAKAVEQIAQNELYEATQRFSQATHASGASFVILGIRLWWAELCQANPVSTADLFRALADLAEARSEADLHNAEKRRRDAVARLFAGVEKIVEDDKA